MNATPSIELSVEWTIVLELVSLSNLLFELVGSG